MPKVKKVAMRASVRNMRSARARPKAPSAGELVVRALDPFQKCGPRTTVEQLYRVIEKTDHGPVSHLVFLDRHGWYCEHGRECSATDVGRRASRGRG